MPRDNSPKERQRKQLERKVARRASYDRILIVSEGEKTEPKYFLEIRTFYKLQTTNIAVFPSAFGTEPLQVVKYAEILFQKGDPHKNIQARSFDKIYAVFDRDDHKSYNDALNLVKTLNGKYINADKKRVTFDAVASIPNFEIWILLHFEDVLSPLHRDEVIKRLKKHMPNYQKGTKDLFSSLQSRQELAIERAQKLLEKNSAYDYPEPYTDVVTLLKLLMNLKK